MFYDNFLEVCAVKQVTPAQVRKALGISQSTMASWKSRSLTPKYGTVKKIADYLHVDWTDLIPEEEQAQSVIGHVKSKLYELGAKDVEEYDDIAYEIKQDMIDEAANPEEYEDAIKTKVSDIQIYLLTSKLQKARLLQINESLSKLNDAGQQKAVERVEELTEVPKYQRQETPKKSPQEPPEEE